MGRGRAKAKQTKVARELKYSSGGTDLDRLRAELAAGTATGAGGAAVSEPVDEVEADDDDDDPYARYADGPADERRSG